MSLPCIPKFQWGYNLESDLTLELPQFPWNRGTGGVWGSDTSASGKPEAFLIRRDYIRWFRYRVLESEMDAFEEFLAWIQESGEPCNVWLDADLDETMHSVYLNSLRFEDGEILQHERDGEYLPLFVVALAFRTADGGQWSHTWTELAVDSEEEES